MKNLLGANWRTTLTGWVALAASAVSLNPALVSFLPANVQPVVTGIAGAVAMASGGAFAAQAKDKQVTGGTVSNDQPL